VNFYINLDLPCISDVVFDYVRDQLADEIKIDRLVEFDGRVVRFETDLAYVPCVVLNGVVTLLEECEVTMTGLSLVREGPQ